MVQELYILKHLCSMLYISDESIKLAFLTMMNKLTYGHQVILKPLLRTLRGMDDKDRLLRIQELDICIEGNTDRKQILTSLMATGVLEPTVFNCVLFQMRGHLPQGCME